MSTDIVFKNISHERAMWAADHGEWCLQQADGTDTDKSCGKWQMEIERSQTLGERRERPGVSSQV